MDESRRESDKVLYQLVQQFEDFKESDANWKIRFEQSTQEFRGSVSTDMETMKDTIGKLMVPYRLLTWIGSLVGAQLLIRYCGTFFDWAKGHMK